MDECHFQQHGTRCRMWIPPELKDPIVFHEPTRKSKAYFGGVRINDGLFVCIQFDVFDAESFKVFLENLLKMRRRGKKALVILDNARYHHAEEISSWLERNRKRIELFFLPPYSPELNPIERVWKLTRRLCTHNRYFENLEDLVAVVEKQFISWFQPNDILRKLCAI
jgi:transposase